MHAHTGTHTFARALNILKFSTFEIISLFIENTLFPNSQNCETNEIHKCVKLTLEESGFASTV